MQLTAAHITCQTNMLVMSFLIIISFMNAYVIAVHILDVFTTLYTFYSKIYTCIFTIQQQPNQYSCLQVIQKDSGWNQPSVEQPFPQKLQKVLSSSKFLLCNWKMNIINREISVFYYNILYTTFPHEGHNQVLQKPIEFTFNCGYKDQKGYKKYLTSILTYCVSTSISRKKERWW